MALTEKQSLLQRKIKEEKEAQEEIQNISDELERYDFSDASHSYYKRVNKTTGKS